MSLKKYMSIARTMIGGPQFRKGRYTQSDITERQVNKLRKQTGKHFTRRFVDDQYSSNVLSKNRK